mgnify:CR=1 FL=1
MITEIKTITELPNEELLLSGTRVCSGCGLAIAYRHALKALGRNTIITIPAGCATVLQGMYPISSVKVSILNTAFETTASSAAGIAAALKARGLADKFNVVGWAGDGGTLDIGLQALSGAAERKDNFIYVCYDNEAYMNTGTQRSSATPSKALTTTTIKGKLQPKKDIIKIMEAHNIEYIATCTPAYPTDLYNKFLKAKEFKGLRFIYIFTPCPPGWGFSQELTIKLSKLAVETGIFELFEIVNNRREYQGVTKRIHKHNFTRKPVSEYFSLQTRFTKLTAADIAEIQKEIDAKFN